jgi:hypothetical protein
MELGRDLTVSGQNGGPVRRGALSLVAEEVL